MSSILTNTSAMVALQTLKGINADLSKTQDEISTGKTISSAKDNAAYLRAKEGELARTIRSNPRIRSVRVHISPQPERGLRAADPAKASITFSTSGGPLPVTQADALRYLVASAVAGMAPENISVIDAQRGLIPLGDDPLLPGGEDGRADELRQNVERLIAARLGPGRAVVEVSLDTITEREEITERRFDPDGRVAISTDTEEKSGSSTNSNGDAVTVASNLPEGDAAAGDRSQSQNSESRERVNFEVSETTREVVRNPGAIRKLSVAVLVDGVRTADATGVETWTPLPAEEMSALRDLVASAVGFDEARGDVITIRSMEFELPAPIPDEPAAGSLLPALVDPMQLIQIGVLAAVALVLGLFVLRPILTRPPRAALPAPQDSLGPALVGEIDDGEFQPGQMNIVSDLPSLPNYGASGMSEPGKGGDDPVVRLRRLIDERRDDAVTVLRTWMDESEREGT